MELWSGCDAEGEGVAMTFARLKILCVTRKGLFSSIAIKTESTERDYN